LLGSNQVNSGANGALESCEGIAFPGRRMILDIIQGSGSRPQRVMCRVDR